MLQRLIVQFLLHYLSSGCLWEVKNRRFKAFSSKKWSRSLRKGGRLLEIPNIVIEFTSVRNFNNMLLLTLLLTFTLDP